jgi:hypothetical protein
MVERFFAISANSLVHGGAFAWEPLSRLIGPASSAPSESVVPVFLGQIFESIVKGNQHSAQILRLRPPTLRLRRDSSNVRNPSHSIL